MVKKCVAKLFGYVPVNDNAIFTICTKGTSILLCVLLNCVALAYYINGKIECKKRQTPFQSAIDISEEMINKLCYTNGTFNVDDPKNSFEYDATAYNPLYYYQNGWIYFFWQAVIAYFPFYLWNALEGGQLKVLSKDLNVPIIEREVKEKRVNHLAEYMNVNINYHNSYAYKFILCEILCFVLIIGQIFFLNYLLNGQFFAYGLNVIFHYYEVFPEIFPLIATCHFYYFSSSEIAACVLPLNGVYDKTFFILWCWFSGVAILALFTLIYRLVICLSPQIRTLLLTTSARLPIEKETEPALNKLKIGDFFLLHQLSKNINASAFKEIIQRLINQTSPYKQMSISLDQDSLEETGTV